MLTSLNVYAKLFLRFFSSSSSCSCHSSDIRTVIYVFVIIWPAIYIRCHRFGLCGNVPEFAPSMVFSVQSHCFLCVPKMWSIVCTWNNAEGNEWGKQQHWRKEKKKKTGKPNNIYKCENEAYKLVHKQTTNEQIDGANVQYIQGMWHLWQMFCTKGHIRNMFDSFELVKWIRTKINTYSEICREFI